MSKKRIIAIVTVIVLLLAAGISVGVFLRGRGESEAADGSQTTVTDPNQVTDGNQPTDGTQTGENNENPTTNPDAGDNETVDNENENADNEAANNNNAVDNDDAGNAGVTTDTNVNNVGETTITRVEEQERLVSKQFLDWWQPMAVNVNAETVLGVNVPQIEVKKGAITNVGGNEFVFAGQNITYVITVTNNGEKDVENIEITDKIPEGTTFVSIEDAFILSKVNDKLTSTVVGTKTTVGTENAEVGVKWVVTIPAGETVTARFTVKVVATEGTISNIAIANGQESKDPTNDEDEGNETKASIINANKSSVITRDGQEVEIAKVGDLITYTITVENTGDAEGTTYIEDTVPAGTEFVSTPEDEDVIVSEAKDSILWSITLGAKGSGTEKVEKQFTVKVTSVANGAITNIADVGGKETETDTVKVEAYIVFEENDGTEVSDMTGIAGEAITNTTMPTTTRAGYTFEGWYDNSELTGNAVKNLPEAYPAGTTTYYAKWEAITGLTGTVNYYLEGTTTKVAESKPLTGLTYGEKVEESAIAISGYNPVAPTEQEITVGLEGNVINFYYTPVTGLEGTVNYYLEGTTTKVAESKPLEGLTYGEKVEESAIAISGYNPVAPTEQEITVGLEGNVINFYYTPVTGLEGTVNYYLEGTTTKVAESKPLEGLTYGEKVEESAIAISGYNPVAPTEQEITVGLEGNVINFYYTPVTGLEGTVNYYLEGTTTKVAESKPLTGLTYGEKVEESAIAISGYNPVAPTEQEITVGLEGNVINFYYEKINVTLTKTAIDEQGYDAEALVKYEEGQEVRFKITVTNNGNSTINSYTVIDELPQELRFAETPEGTTVNGDTLTWILSDLAPKASESIIITTIVNEDKWSAEPENSYNTIIYPKVADGTEKTMTSSEYRNNRELYETDSSYVNCAFFIYNPENGEVPHETEGTQHWAGSLPGEFSDAGMGRVNGTKYTTLTAIENINSVIDTHNQIQEVIEFAPDYDPGEGKVVLWYVSKNSAWAREETVNGVTAYVRYHCDGVVVELDDNTYAITNTVIGSDGSTATDMVFAIDNGSASNQAETATTYTRSAVTYSKGIMTAVLEDTNNGVLTTNNVENVIGKIDEAEETNNVETESTVDNATTNVENNEVVNDTVETENTETDVDKDNKTDETVDNTVENETVESENTVTDVDNKTDETDETVEPENTVTDVEKTTDKTVDNTDVTEPVDSPVPETVEPTSVENEVTQSTEQVDTKTE